MTAQQTLAQAEAERDRLAAKARAAGDVADRLAGERRERIEAEHGKWAAAVLAGHVAEEARLTAAERTAEREFRQAAVEGDARAAYFTWIDARAAVNVHRDRMIQARSWAGREQVDDGGGYVHRDVPPYGAEIDRALAAEASARFVDRQEALQRELNELDR